MVPTRAAWRCLDGNEAAALVAHRLSDVCAIYPITPSSSLCESLIGYLKKYRVDKDGKATFAVVQAEDEIASLGMVIGASWAGARSMTATTRSRPYRMTPKAVLTPHCSRKAATTVCPARRW